MKIQLDPNTFKHMPTWMRHAIGDEMIDQLHADPEMFSLLSYKDRLSRAYRALTSAL